MDLLNSNDVAMEDWKASLVSLRTMLDDLKASQEKPEAECTCLPQQDKDLEGDGLNAKQ